MTTKIFTRLAATMVLLAGSTAFAADSTIAHLNLLKVLETYRESDPASIRLREEVDRMRQEFQIKRSSIEIMRQAATQLRENLNDDEMAEKTRAITDKSNELIAVINEAQRELKAKEEFLQSAISETVRAAVGEVAKEGGYLYILDGSQRPVLFADESLDVTDTVLKKIMKDQ